MTGTEPDAELAYHLQELRADLVIVRDDLERAGEALDRRSFVGAEALLEHDLEVHVPRALALLGSSPPVMTMARRDLDAGDAARAAASAGRQIAAALAALGGEAVPPADRVLIAAEAIDIARRIVATASGDLR